MPTARPTLATALLTMLLCAAPAAGKGIVGVTACGADGCTKVGDRVRPGDEPALLETGPVTRAPRGDAGAFVRLSVRIGVPEANEVMRVIYAPRHGLFAWTDESGGLSWTQRTGDDRARLGRIVAGVRPFPASEPVPAAAASQSSEPAARVVEVVAPPAAHSGDGGSATPWIAGGLAALLLVAGAWGGRTVLRSPRRT